MNSAAILLEDPKYPHNLSAVVRACACFGVERLYWTGSRIDQRGSGPKARLPREERLAGYRSSVEWNPISTEAELQSITNGRIPVAVEARGDFQSLAWFEHPHNPLYLFGPEDGTLSGRYLSLAYQHLVIPARFCLNLAAAVNIVLWDRTAKGIRKGEPPFEFAERTHLLWGLNE